jgi:hypothetical protein
MTVTKFVFPEYVTDADVKALDVVQTAATTLAESPYNDGTEKSPDDMIVEASMAGAFGGWRVGCIETLRMAIRGAFAHLTAEEMLAAIRDDAKAEEIIRDAKER